MTNLVVSALSLLCWIIGLGLCADLLFSDDIEHVKSSLRQNIIGKCSVSINVSAADISIDLIPCKEGEREQYSREPDAYTMVSAGLAEGRVKCKPFSERWMMGKENSWQLPQKHPRNNKTNCVMVSQLASKSPVRFYQRDKANYDLFYMISAKKVIIQEQGILGLRCGYIQQHEGCETMYKFIGRKWHQKCYSNITSQGISWDSYFVPSKWTNDQRVALSSCQGPRESASLSLPMRLNKVFVITAGWDSNYHHLISDGLTRLIRHYEFLQSNPDIFIHIRYSEQYARKAHVKQAAKTTRELLMTFLNISLSRLVHGTIIADEVFLPKATRCNEPMAHALELRLLANKFLSIAMASYTRQLGKTCGAVHEAIGKERRKHVVFMHRPCNSTEACSKSWREWSHQQMIQFQDILRVVFWNHSVVTLSPDNDCWSKCLACQIKLLRRTDVLIGNHGAGLTNMMFLKPDAVVFEIVGQFDGRMTPVCGYHGPLAAVFGVHHYIYYYDWKCNSTIDSLAVATEAYNFYNKMKRLRLGI